MELLGILAGLGLLAVEITRSVPAILQVRKTQSSDGVSPSSLGVLAGTGLGWIILAILVGSPWVLLANVLWITLHVILCLEISRIDPQKRRGIIQSSLRSAGIFATAVFFAQFLIPLQEALGLLLGAAMIFYAIPATYAGLTSASTRGLSLLSLSVNAIEGIIYLFSGLGLLHMNSHEGLIWGFIIFGTVSILSNGLRLTRVAYRRSRGLDSVEHISVGSNAI